MPRGQKCTMTRREIRAAVKIGREKFWDRVAENKSPDENPLDYQLELEIEFYKMTGKIWRDQFCRPPDCVWKKKQDRVGLKRMED